MNDFQWDSLNPHPFDQMPAGATVPDHSSTATRFALLEPERACVRVYLRFSKGPIHTSLGIQNESADKDVAITEATHLVLMPGDGV